MLVLLSPIIFRKKLQLILKKNIGYDYSQDMDHQNGIYLKKVTSYEEYTHYQQRWNNLIQMNRDDFNNYFVMIIATENTSMIGLTVSNITATEDTLFIELYQNDTEDVKNNVLSIKIPLEQLRDKIIFKKVGLQPISTIHTNIKDLPPNYSKKEAIADRCFVIENGKIILDTKYLLDEFVENSTQSKSSFIRIANFDNVQGISITDIENIDGKYYVCQDNTRLKENKKICYEIGNKFILSGLKGTDVIIAYIQDEFNNQFSIFYTY